MSITKKPNRHVVALLTFIVLLPLVYFIPPWVISNITQDHLRVTIISVAFIVPIISYIALPCLIKVYSRMKV